MAGQHFSNGKSDDEAGTGGCRLTEELANWEFVKSGNNRKDLVIDDLRKHLGRFPAGTTAHDARALLAEAIWDGLRPTSTVEALREFIEEFPTIEWAKIARIWLKDAEQRASGKSWADGLRSIMKSDRLAPSNRLELRAPRGDQSQVHLFGQRQNTLFGDVNAQREAESPGAWQRPPPRMGRYTLLVLVLLFAAWICSAVDHSGIVGETFYFGFIPLVLTIAAALAVIVAGFVKLLRRILRSLDPRS